MVRASRDVTRRSFYTAVKTAYAFDFNELYAFKRRAINRHWPVRLSRMHDEQHAPPV